MRLRILLPTEVLVDANVSKVVAEAENGSFGLLPRHIDVVTALVPGMLAYVDSDGRQQLVGIDEGILVKCGAEVRVATERAIRGTNLATLKREVERWFLEMDEQAAIVPGQRLKQLFGLLIVVVTELRFSRWSCREGRKTWACFLRPVLRPDEAAEHRLPTDASLSYASLPVMSARSVRPAPFRCWVVPDVGEGEEESPWKRN